MLLPVGLAVIASMTYHREVVQVPFELWLAVTVLLLTSLCLDWLVYRAVVGAGLKDTLGAWFASKALGYTVSVAAFRTIWSSRLAWHRTSKFKSSSRLRRAFSETGPETFLGVTILTAVGLSLYHLPVPGLLLMLLLGLGMQALGYLSSPLFAVIAELTREKPSLEPAQKAASTLREPAPLPPGRPSRAGALPAGAVAVARRLGTDEASLAWTRERGLLSQGET